MRSILSQPELDQRHHGAECALDDLHAGSDGGTDIGAL
jgi:hypothetical protein